jgi:hypothetical protein
MRPYAARRTLMHENTDTIGYRLSAIGYFHIRRSIVGRAAGRRLAALALALIVCGGCADQAAGPVARPSPTIAAPVLRFSPTPAVPGALATSPPIVPARTATPPAAQPSATPPTATTPLAAQPSATPPPAPFAYMWPTYLPANMQVSRAETRVAHEGEIGQNGVGFFIVTFTDGAAKLVIGGGATETLPLAGEQRHITVSGRAATLTSSGEQRQLAFVESSGSLFVYGSHLSEEELLRVAGSLQPIDVRDLRALVGET